MKTEILNIKDITLGNIKNGEVTLIQLDEIYREIGFVFVGSEGQFKQIKKERSNFYNINKN